MEWSTELKGTEGEELTRHPLLADAAAGEMRAGGQTTLDPHNTLDDGYDGGGCCSVPLFRTTLY